MFPIHPTLNKRNVDKFVSLTPDHRVPIPLILRDRGATGDQHSTIPRPAENGQVYRALEAISNKLEKDDSSLLCISTQYWVIQKLSIESDLIEPVYPRCDARPVRVPSQGIAPEPTHRINKSTRSYTQVDSSRGESRGSTRADSGLGARTSRLALRQKPRQHKSRL